MSESRPPVIHSAQALPLSSTAANGPSTSSPLRTTQSAQATQADVRAPETHQPPISQSPPSPLSTQDSASPSDCGTSFGEPLYEWPSPPPEMAGPSGDLHLGLGGSGMVFDLLFPVVSEHSPPLPVSPDELVDILTEDDDDMTDVTRQAGNAPVALLPPSPQRGLSLLPGTGSASLELLSHYLSVTSRSMDNGSTTENPFIVQLVPLAFNSDLVLQLILTQSAVHRMAASTRALISQRSEQQHQPLLPDRTAVATRHYNGSLRLFRRRLSCYTSQQPVDILTLAVGALILCFVEVSLPLHITSAYLYVLTLCCLQRRPREISTAPFSTI